MKPGSSGRVRADKLILLSLVLLAFALRLYHLDYQSLWRDEVDAILFAQRDLSGLKTLFVTPGHNGPLYYAALHCWIALVGTSEFSVRYLPLICGVLAVPVLYLLGRRWVGERGGLIAALLCATSPFLIWYGQDGKMYALLFLLSMLSTQVYVLALERNRSYLWAGYVLLVALSFYVHLLAVLIVPFHVLLFLVTWPQYRGAWKAWLATFAVLALPYLPLAHWETRLLVGPFTTGHHFYALHEILTILLFSFSLSAASHSSVLVLALFVFLLLAGLLLHVRDRDRGTRRSVRTLLRRHQDSIILGLYLFVPVICLFLISLGMPIFTDRYLITVVPAFVLLMACGVVAVRDRSRLLALACLALVLVSNTYAVVLQGHTKIKSDFRSVARYVQDEGRGDLIVFLIPHGRQVFDYYYQGAYAWVDAPYTNDGTAADVAAQAMEEATAGHRQVWLVVTEPELWDSRGLVQQWFGDSGALLQERDFARVDVYLYDLGTAKPEAASEVFSAGQLRLAGVAWLLPVC